MYKIALQSSGVLLYYVSVFHDNSGRIYKYNMPYYTYKSH